MKIRSSKIIATVSCTVLVAAVGLVLFIFSGAGPDRLFHPAGMHDTSTRGPDSPFELRDVALESLTSEQRDLLVERIVLELRQRYGKTISRIGTQASLLDVRNQILSLFPGDEGKFHQIIRLAFPDYADEVISTLNRLDQYYRWLEDNAGLLSRMSSLERKAALFEKQRELFGEAADEIWSGEILASEARTAAMQDTMAVLGESRETSLENKLDIFQSTLRQTYENTPDEHVLKQRFLLAKVFFSIESVQEELHAMSPEQRQFKMDQIRREMAFSEEEIVNMQVLDAERNQVWETGLQYMDERDTIFSRYDGEDQEDQLKALREKYFRDEADTIELEEKEGFYRFERPRVFGRN
jgi:hypothetical protein